MVRHLNASLGSNASVSYFTAASLVVAGAAQRNTAVVIGPHMMSFNVALDAASPHETFRVDVTWPNVRLARTPEWCVSVAHTKK